MLLALTCSCILLCVVPGALKLGTEPTGPPACLPGELGFLSAPTVSSASLSAPYNVLPSEGKSPNELITHMNEGQEVPITVNASDLIHEEKDPFS